MKQTNEKNPPPNFKIHKLVFSYIVNTHTWFHLGKSYIGEMEKVWGHTVFLNNLYKHT